MAAKGALAGNMGRLLGVGPGRGIALILLITGLVGALAPGFALLIPSIRQVELELTDAPGSSEADPAV